MPPNEKISDLDAAAPLVLTDHVLIARGAAAPNLKATIQAVLALGGGVGGGGTINKIPLWISPGVLGDSALSQSGSSIVVVRITAIGVELASQVHNLDNTDAASTAVFGATVAGASSGDPYSRWRVDGFQTYVLGIDNSDGDKLVGSVGSDLGTGNWLEVTTARGVTLDAASGQTVSLAVNSVEELQVSGTAVVIPSNGFQVTAGMAAFGRPIISTVQLVVQRTDALTTDIFRIIQGGTGDCTMAFVLASGDDWALGIDNDDDDSLKIGNNIGDVGSLTKVVLTVGGNFGIGDATPTIMFSVDEKSGHTSIGGYAIKLTNKTGASTTKGDLVRASTSTDDAFEVPLANDESVIGVVLETGVADGDEAWIVVGGKGEVRIDGSGCTHGDRLGTGAVPGVASVLNSPSLAEHFQEIGHSVQTGGAAAIVRTDLHFN